MKLNLKNFKNLPLSSNQKRLWIISQQDKNNPSYNLQLTYHLKGVLNYPLFQKSLDILFIRQHTLFSIFKQKDGSPYCEIIPRPVKISYIDYSSEDPESGKKKIYAFIGKDTRIPFDLEVGPLYRLYLLKQDEINYFFHTW